MVNNAERVEISGSLDAVLIYEDFTSIEVELGVEREWKGHELSTPVMVQPSLLAHR